MSLSKNSTKAKATKQLLDRSNSGCDYTIALVGNPNVGKSTVFNALTNLNQHTGNWSGKTVAAACGKHHFQGLTYYIVDLPGTYSLMTHSQEEEIARDFIYAGSADVTVVVCDATTLERNLNLLLQTLLLTQKVVLCLNLMDEAAKKEITIDLSGLSRALGIPVIGIEARSKKGLDELMTAVSAIAKGEIKPCPLRLTYPSIIEDKLAEIANVLAAWGIPSDDCRFYSLQLLFNDGALHKTLQKISMQNQQQELHYLLKPTKSELSRETINDAFVTANIQEAKKICRRYVHFNNQTYQQKDRQLDKILTSPLTGIPIMLGLLALIFWLTITGANYPSQLLSSLLFSLGEKISVLLTALGVSQWLNDLLILGVYRVLAWVISVMLPPMAIFFPLFTLLEDFGYLPRVAFNLDHCFQKACTCGKQALTICMGFGCNAAGIVGCRIIDSPRERMIAILTNSFIPCNGRFPMLIAIITMFFVSGVSLGIQSIIASGLLTLIVLLGIIMTFIVSRVLSKTILKGEPSSFTLELPPYRRPQIVQVIIRSIFDRTLFVLARAVMVAAPAGLIIWLLANVNVQGETLLGMLAGFLNPFGQLLGMDGVILLAFILGFPANEIVVPIMIMTYLSCGNIVEMDNLNTLKVLLVENGWTWVTAVCTMLFALMHWPCSTACLTIKKETGSWKWVALAIILPAVVGMGLCFVFAQTMKLFGFC